MINGLDIFYTKVNKGNGLKTVENKGKGCYMTKKKSQRGSGLKILKIIFYIIYERL